MNLIFFLFLVLLVAVWTGGLLWVTPLGWHIARRWRQLVGWRSEDYDYYQVKLDSPVLWRINRYAIDAEFELSCNQPDNWTGTGLHRTDLCTARLHLLKYEEARSKFPLAFK